MLRHLEAWRRHRIPALLNRLNDWILLVLQPAVYWRVAWHRLYKSERSVIEEKARQNLENPYIIHPCSYFRSVWDTVIIVVLMITLVVLPIELAFYSEDHSVVSWKAFNITIDTIFLLDIIVNFRTAVVHAKNDQVILGNKSIALHYLRKWFLVDFVSSLPIDYIVLSVMESRIIRIIKLLTLLKVFRLARLMRYLYKLEEVMGISGDLLRIVNLTVLVVVFAHWNACLQYFVTFYMDFPPESWVVLSGIMKSDVSVWQKYTLAMYRALSHMISIGYGMNPPQTNAERWTVMISMMLGATFYALFIAHMSSIIMTLDSSGRMYEEKIEEVKDYLRFRRVPVDLQSRVLNYFELRYQRKYFDEKCILNQTNISMPLKRDIYMHNCRTLVEKVPFLTSAPVEFVFDIITKLQLQVYSKGDVIVQAGRRGKSMYFLEHGKVEVRLAGGQVINVLADGSYFGEIAMLMEERRVASVVAVSPCYIYCLTKRHFREALADYPELIETMKRTARLRLKSIVDPGMWTAKLATGVGDSSKILDEEDDWTEPQTEPDFNTDLLAASSEELSECTDDAIE